MTATAPSATERSRPTAASNFPPTRSPADGRLRQRRPAARPARPNAAGPRTTSPPCGSAWPTTSRPGRWPPGWSRSAWTGSRRSSPSPLANVIVLLPMLLTGHAGPKYGIPFPVLARASFGLRGANLPALVRAAVACAWFGIQTWIGGEGIFLLAGKLFGDGWADAGAGRRLPVDPVAVVRRLLGVESPSSPAGMETLRRFENWAAPFVLVGARRRCWSGSASRPAASVRCSTSRPPGLGQRLLEGLLPLPHGHDRLLVHPVAQHPRLHPLRRRPARPDLGPGPGPAHHHDRLRPAVGPGHLRLPGRLRRSRSGTRSRSPPSCDNWRRPAVRPGHRPGRDPVGEHRRQRGLARPTTCPTSRRGSSTSAPARSSPAWWASSSSRGS